MRKILHDPHLFLMKLGAAVILAIELYKFIRFVAER